MDIAKIKEQLDMAHRLIDGEASSSKQVAEGARIVRDLAENADSLAAVSIRTLLHAGIADGLKLSFD